jgi:hypothetical protein
MVREWLHAGIDKRFEHLVGAGPWSHRHNGLDSDLADRERVLPLEESAVKLGSR